MQTLVPEDLEELNVYIKLVRNYLTDYPEVNHLQPDTEEFSDAKIEQAILMALEIFNSCVGHLTNKTLSGFPVPTLLVMGGCAYTLFSGGILQARNHFSVSDGNTSGPISEKTDIYRVWARELQDNFMAMSAKYKEAVNMSEGYKSLSSSYMLSHFRNRNLKEMR